MLLGASTTYLACGTPCERYSRDERWSSAYAACTEELRTTKNDDVSIAAARAAYYLHRDEDVVRLVSPLLDGTRSADSLSLLGQIAFRRADLTSALHHLTAASCGHMIRGEAKAYSRDAHQLSGVWWELGNYDAALGAEAAAREAATQAGDDRMAFYVDVAHADISRVLGEDRVAEQALDRAIRKATRDEDLILAKVKQGVLYTQLNRPNLARARLSEALNGELLRNRPRPAIIGPALMNLAHLDRLDHQPARALAEIEWAHRAGSDDMGYHLYRGLMLADLGQLAEAARELAVSAATHPSGRWSWWVPYQRAVVAARMEDDAAATAFDRQAIARIIELAASSGHHGATLVASHREPFEHLVGLLAKVKDWRAIVDVVATMDRTHILHARDTQDTFSPNSTDRPARHEPRRMPGHVEVKTLLEAWKLRRLVIAVSDGTDVWRIDIKGGVPTGRNVGDGHELGRLAARLEANPDDRDAASKLGRALVPGDLGMDEELVILPIGPVSRAPIAALRIDGSLVLARWPLMRAVGVLPEERDIAFDPDRVVVIGDPDGSLDAARNEAREVANRFQGALKLGCEATRAELTRSGGASLLHIAAHGDRSAIHLFDGDLSVDRGLPAAKLVVLASCNASTGVDDAGNGSVAQAFIEAGAETVISARWSVGDMATQRLLAAFYDNRGADGLYTATALAKAQVDMQSRLPVRDWAGFEVLLGRPRLVDRASVVLH